MIVRGIALLLGVAGCSTPPAEFRGGAINPVCVILCDAKFTNSDADPGASLNSTQSNTQSGGSNTHSE